MLTIWESQVLLSTSLKARKRIRTIHFPCVPPKACTDSTLDRVYIATNHSFDFWPHLRGRCSLRYLVLGFELLPTSQSWRRTGRTECGPLAMMRSAIRVGTITLGQSMVGRMNFLILSASITERVCINSSTPIIWCDIRALLTSTVFQEATRT